MRFANNSGLTIVELNVSLLEERTLRDGERLTIEVSNSFIQHRKEAVDSILRGRNSLCKNIFVHGLLKKDS